MIDITVLVLPATMIATAYLLRIVFEFIINLKAAKESKKILNNTNKTMKLMNKFLSKYIEDEFGEDSEDNRICK